MAAAVAEFPLLKVTPGYGRAADTDIFKKGDKSYTIKSTLGITTELIFVNPEDVPDELIAKPDNFSKEAEQKKVRGSKQNGYMISIPFPQKSYYNRETFGQIQSIGPSRYNYSKTPDESPRYIVSVFHKEVPAGHSGQGRQGSYTLYDNHGQSYGFTYWGGFGLNTNQPAFVYCFYNDKLFPKQLPDILIDFKKSNYDSSIGSIIAGQSTKPINIDTIFKYIGDMADMVKCETYHNRFNNTEPSKIVSNMEPSKEVKNMEPSKTINKRTATRHNLNKNNNRKSNVKTMFNKLKNKLVKK